MGFRASIQNTAHSVVQASSFRSLSSHILMSGQKRTSSTMEAFHQVFVTTLKQPVVSYSISYAGFPVARPIKPLLDLSQFHTRQFSKDRMLVLAEERAEM